MHPQAPAERPEATRAQGLSCITGGTPALKVQTADATEKPGADSGLLAFLHGAGVMPAMQEGSGSGQE